MYMYMYMYIYVYVYVYEMAMCVCNVYVYVYCGAKLNSFFEKSEGPPGTNPAIAENFGFANFKRSNDFICSVSRNQKTPCHESRLKELHGTVIRLCRENRIKKDE